MGNVAHLLTRPRPPADLVSITGLASPDLFLPAPDLTEWIRAAYLHKDGALYTHEHDHLEQARIGCLWTNAENSRHMRRIVGQTELAENIGVRLGAWQKGRGFQQLRDWFGQIPDFLITFDALYANEVDDATFAALVDHELYHCAQAEDEFGQPDFRKADGRPKYAIRGHDVEEFAGVVRRFGIEAAGQGAVDLVIAAAKRPEIAMAKLTQACGTCLQRAAA